MLYIIDIDNHSFATSSNAVDPQSVYPKLFYATSVNNYEDPDNPLVTIKHKEDGSSLVNSYPILEITLDGTAYTDKEDFVAAFNALMNSGSESSGGALEDVVTELEEVVTELEALNLATTGMAADIAGIETDVENIAADVAVIEADTALIKANQTNGTQKSMIVDGSGDVVGSTDNAMDVAIKALAVPDAVTSTVDLAASLYVPNSAGRRLTYGIGSVQMLSANISATTTFYLELSVDGTNWDNAVDAGVDVSDTLVVNVTKVVNFESMVGIYWRIRFASGNTGVITYHILG
jgi:hypothetical protein